MNELKEVVKAIQEKDEQVFSLLNVFPHMVWMATPKGKFDYFNSPFIEFTGNKGTKAPTTEWKSILHPDDVEQSLEKWEKSLKSGSLFEVEHRIGRASDGAYLWYLTKAVPVRNKQGEIIKWLGSSVDIHNQKRVEERLSGFVYIASHDLRSPVNNLKSLISLFKTRPTQEWEKLLSLLDLSAERLSETLDGLSDLVAIEKSNEAAGQLYFDQVFDRVVEELQAQIKESGASITTNFSACPKIQYPESYLYRVFSGLLTNAVMYSVPGKKNDIQVLSKRKGDLVELTFSDKGTGIDLSRYGEKIFRPFTRLTTAGKGRGMGLFLLKNIVEKNGGSMEVESQAEEGTTVKVFLREYRA